MLNAIRGFSMSRQNGLFINSCFAHCQTERQDTWFADDSPLIGTKVRMMWLYMTMSIVVRQAHEKPNCHYQARMDDGYDSGEETNQTICQTSIEKPTYAVRTKAKGMLKFKWFGLLPTSSTGFTNENRTNISKKIRESDKFSTKAFCLLVSHNTGFK